MLIRILIVGLIAVFSLAGLSGCGNGEAPPASGSESEEAAEEGVTEESVSEAGSDEGLYGKYLTVADVEEVTGMSGLTSKEEAITLKFLGDDGTVILEVRFDGSSFYEDEVVANEEYYTPVPDLGDKAAICIPDMPYRVTFRKGDHGIMVQTIPKDGNLPVTGEQLIILAKTVSSRL
jgi:hypothetical protein